MKMKLQHFTAPKPSGNLVYLLSVNNKNNNFLKTFLTQNDLSLNPGAPLITMVTVNHAWCCLTTTCRSLSLFDE